jgi:hypothetical protein
MILYALSVHTKPEQVIRLIQALYSSDDLFYINIFGADSDKKRHEWMNSLHVVEKENVFFSFKYSDAWGTINQVNAHIDAMKHFADYPYSYFINLSGQCYPIKSIKAIKEILSKNEHSYIAFNKMPDYTEYEKNKNLYCPPNTKFHQRFEYCYYPVPNILPVQFLKEMIKIRKDINIFIKIRRRNKALLHSLDLYKGSSWFCLHKNHIQYILNFLKNNPDFLNFFSTVLCCDEHFFQTLLLNSPHKSLIVNDNLRYIVWGDTTSTPEILGSANLNDILNSGKLFARKFDIEIDSKILDLIDLNIKDENLNL